MEWIECTAYTVRAAAVVVVVVVAG